jgi:hypothetical protein
MYGEGLHKRYTLRLPHTFLGQSNGVFPNLCRATTLLTPHSADKRPKTLLQVGAKNRGIFSHKLEGLSNIGHSSGYNLGLGAPTLTDKLGDSLHKL